jgi:hypothetical protein
VCVCVLVILVSSLRGEVSCWVGQSILSVLEVAPTHFGAKSFFGTTIMFRSNGGGALLGVFNVRVASPSAHFLHLKKCTVFASDLGLLARFVLRTIVKIFW